MNKNERRARGGHGRELPWGWPFGVIAMSGALSGLPLHSHAQTPPTPEQVIQEGLRRQEERTREQQKLLAPRADELVPGTRKSAKPEFPQESTCFVVNEVTLGGKDSARFSWLVDAALPYIRRCVGVKGLGFIAGELDAKLRERGFATTRVGLPPQNLQGGQLLIHIQAGRLSDVRKEGLLDYLRPDGKSQVTVEYAGHKPVRVNTVVVSTQHSESVANDQIHEDVINHVIRSVVPGEMMDAGTEFHINPTGRFVIGGPQGDTGLTGRKIIVDTYGGAGAHGGGAFSGKDPTKVDRSACYMARYIAKNIVAAGLAERCEVQLAYAIGIADPVSVLVDTKGTSTVDEEKLSGMVREHFKLTPAGIIESLNLRRPIFRKTAAYGHFGRNEPEFTWERTDKA